MAFGGTPHTVKRSHRIFFAMLALCVATGCAPPHAVTLFYELRVPKTARFDPETSFDFVTDSSAAGTPLRLTQRREDGDYVIFADSCLIFAGERRRAMVVRTDGQRSQVFRLPVPRTPKPADWTNWQRPASTGGTEAVWTFMDDSKQNDRSTNAPTDCFELRFKIAEGDSP